MTEQELQVIRHFKILLDRRLRGYQVIVFGSRARGDADPDSDLDVLIITEEPRTPALREFVSGCAWESGFDSGIMVSSVLVSRADWESGPQRMSLLARAIEREGIAV